MPGAKPIGTGYGWYPDTRRHGCTGISAGNRSGPLDFGQKAERQHDQIIKVNGL